MATEWLMRDDVHSRYAEQRDDSCPEWERTWQCKILSCYLEQCEI